MPRGVPSNRLWRGLEFIDDWLTRQQAPFCACGCGGKIVLKRAHRHAGIPKFLLGHHARVRHGNYKGVDLWVAANQGKHVCQCGCGGEIVIHPRHHSVGGPRYSPNHPPPPSFGIGEEHPRFIKDRSEVVRPRRFPTWMKAIVFDAFGYRCAWCKVLDVLECDHILPASLGGEAVIDNAQALCPSCHRWKTAIEPTSRKGKTPESRSRKPKGARHADHRKPAQLS